MSSTLQQKIREFIEVNQFPLAAFEREAGLKTIVVRNILRGLSKRPTSDTLQALATYMGVTVPELLGGETKPSRILPQSLSSPVIENADLLSESLGITLKMAKKDGHRLTIKQAFGLAEDVYKYALQKKSPHADTDFVKWVLEKTKA